MGLGYDCSFVGNSHFSDNSYQIHQYKTITKGIPLSVAKEEGADGEVSQFQALATALASTIGTDNIIKLREHPFIQSNECSHVQR